ncbi:MAG: copper chaperone PCu(A)C [Betaproteobacteria bacterium]|nr:copper chaperone PCu(A)C [Betaproteobacteria bacterium]
MFRRSLAVLAGMLIAMSSMAQVVVTKPWVRGTVPGQKATGAFMEISSAEPVELVSIASPAAGLVEIHEMILEGTVMKMRAIAKLDVPAGRKVELKPGGYHVMMMELAKPLKKGDTVPLKLIFRGKDRKPVTVEVKAEVRDLNAPANVPEHKGH